MSTIVIDLKENSYEDLVRKAETFSTDWGFKTTRTEKTGDVTEIRVENDGDMITGDKITVNLVFKKGKDSNAVVEMNSGSGLSKAVSAGEMLLFLTSPIGPLVLIGGGGLAYNIYAASKKKMEFIRNLEEYISAFAVG